MKFTYYTIIGRNIDLLKGHIDNVKNYAGFNEMNCNKEILIIIYKNNKIHENTTNEIINYCKKEELKYYVYEEKTNNFLINLYNCWNLGYEKSDDGYIFRGGSDQVFSKNSFIEIYEQAEILRKKGVKNILQANTIENSVRLNEMNVKSRHFMRDFGDSFNNFKYKEFEKFIDEINVNIQNNLLDINESLKHWNHPTAFNSSLGFINRTDGCSWLMTKQDWIDYGPLPVIENGHTGDVIIHDKLQIAGYLNYIVKNCVTYHFVRGESNKITQ
jgi:hypothetical protein